MASHPHPSQYPTLKAPTPFSPTSPRHFLLHRNKAQLPTRLAELRSFPTNAPHHTRDRIHLPPHPCNVLTGPRWPDCGNGRIPDRQDHPRLSSQLSAILRWASGCGN
jgi:hypothetical protein